MGYLKEQASYLRGLAEGMNVGETSKEAKIIMGMLALLDDMAGAVEENETAMVELEEWVADIADDLEEIDAFDPDFDQDDGDRVLDDMLELRCPHCGDTVFFDMDLVESHDDLVCPNCERMVIAADNPT